MPLYCTACFGFLAIYCLYGSWVYDVYDVYEPMFWERTRGSQRALVYISPAGASSSIGLGASRISHGIIDI